MTCRRRVTGRRSSVSVDGGLGGDERLTVFVPAQRELVDCSGRTAGPPQLDVDDRLLAVGVDELDGSDLDVVVVPEVDLVVVRAGLATLELGSEL